MAINKTKKAAEKANEAPEITSLEVTRAHEFKSGDISFDMVVNGINIYNCTYMNESDKIKEPFVSFPSRKGSDGKYYSFVWFKVTDEILSEIEKGIEAVL